MHSLEEILDWMWQVELGQTDSKPTDQLAEEIREDF